MSLVAGKRYVNCEMSEVVGSIMGFQSHAKRHNSLTLTLGSQRMVQSLFYLFSMYYLLFSPECYIKRETTDDKCEDFIFIVSLLTKKYEKLLLT